MSNNYGERAFILTTDNQLIHIVTESQGNGFVLDSISFYKYLSKGKIRAMVHFHSETCNPSIKDIQSMLLWEGMNWVIVSKGCIGCFTQEKEPELPGLGIREVSCDTLLTKEVKDFLMEFSH